MTITAVRLKKDASAANWMWLESNSLKLAKDTRVLTVKPML